MKKIIALAMCAGMLFSSCSDFLDRYPKGRWHSENMPETDLDMSILAQAKLMEAYSGLRAWGFVWPALAMHNYTTPDSYKGSSPADGGADLMAFETMSFNPSNGVITDYYSNAFSVISKVNEALNMISQIDDSDPKKQELDCQAKFWRACMYYRLTQAFGDVPYINRYMLPTEKAPARSNVDEVRAKYIAELEAIIPMLPTRKEIVASGNYMVPTQNAARALIAKTYMYQKNWTMAKAYTQQIIESGDNDLSTPFNEIFDEEQEFGPESVLEIYCELRPSEKIYMGSQYGQIIGFRGVPNLGWGFNVPADALRNAFEEGDPRYAATVIEPGDDLDGRPAQPSDVDYQNRKGYAKKAEFERYGRSEGDQAQWRNIRLIRYADILLMHAECCCELGDAENIKEALDKLEMVRNRARGGNASVLPKVTTTDKTELMEAIRHERRIELALEFEQYFDLVRWGIAKDRIDNFAVGRHELFPIPQSEIDKSEGVLTQNPGYNG